MRSERNIRFVMAAGLLLVANAYAADVRMSVEPALISLLDRAVLKIEYLDAKGAAIDIPEVEGIRIEYRGPQTQYKFVNGTPNAAGTVEETYDFSVDNCGVVNGSFPDNRVATRIDDQLHVYQHVFNTCTELTVSTNEFEKESFQVKPNPFTNNTTVVLPTEGRFDVIMIDVTGRIVRNFNNVNGEVSIERGNLNAGMYFLNVVNEAGNVNSSKVLIQ